MKRLHVVAGVLEDAHGRVLVTERPPGKHHAGTWEFPGGKCEDDEAPLAALRRELDEELGIAVESAEALVRVPWRYATHHVDLDVHRIVRWRGEPHGREGQGVQWLDAAALRAVPMPPADRPVVAVLQLAPVMLVTPAELAPDALLDAVDAALRDGVRLVQLRADRETTTRVGARVRALTRAHAATLIVNGDPALALALDADGVQLPAAAARALAGRPVGPERWLGVSCHDAAELAHALAIGADYAVVGAVQATATHPDRAPLGWPGFAALVDDFPLPVYAIGGLAPADLGTARRHGAFGVAGIRAFTQAG